MALINLIPGMGGAIGGLVNDTVSLLENAASCGPEDPVSCLLAIVNLAEVVFDAWAAFFPSRPKVGKDSASDDTALFYIPSANPIIALWGIGIRDLESQGIPTSASGGSGYTAQLNLANAALTDLKTQFDTPAGAALQFQGAPVTGQAVFGMYHFLGFQMNHPDSNSTAITARTTLDNLYLQLVAEGAIDPDTGFPPPNLTTPQKCPAGYIFDATAQKCVPLKPDGTACPTGQMYDAASGTCILIPGTQPTCPTGYQWDATQGKCVQIPGTIIPPPFDPDADEFNDCCAETQAALAALLAAVQAMNTNASDPTCCANVVSAIAGVTAQLGQLVLLLQQFTAGSTAIDLAPITAALTAIGADLAKLSGSAGAPINVTITNPAEPPTITVNAPGPDLTQVNQALGTVAQQGDVPEALIQQLISDGYIEQGYSGLLQGSPWSHVLSVIHALANSRLVQKFTAAEVAAAENDPLLGATYNKVITGKGKSPTDIKSLTSSDLADFVTDSSAAVFAKVFGASGAIFSPIVNGVLTAHRAEIARLQNVQPCAEGPIATELLTEAIGASIAAHFASVAVEAIYPTKNLGFEKIAELIAALAGVEDIIKGIVGVEVSQLVAIPHRYCINQQGRTILPGMGDATSLAARGLITAAQADQLLAFNGLSAQYAPAELAGAYSGISARQLIRLFGTGLFTAADIQDELTFQGMRPVSQHRYQLVAPYLATQTERTKLIGALESEYAAGLMSDADLTGAIDSAENNTDRDSLIINAAHSKERTTIAKALESEYTTMYIASLIDHPTYTGNLTGMGLQQWKVDALAGIADARRAATLARQMAAEERALVRATAAKERQAAMEGFATGALNAPALAAALVATGLTAEQAAAWTALATLKQAGALRWVYGLQLPPAQATILHERVTALTNQTKKTYITPVQYADQLKALGISEKWINALVAAAVAEIAATKGGTAVAVQTN